MSPEANKPQKPTEISTDKHPEGVRPFSADLADVHEQLELPNDPSAIDPVTGNVEFDRISETNSALPTTQESSPQVEAEKRSAFKKWVAGIIGGAVLAGGGYVVTKATGGSGEAVEPEASQPTVAAPVSPGANSPQPETSTSPEPTPEVGGEALITEVKRKPSAEQIQYVIDTPVNIESYPTAREALSALGDRWNIMANSGVIDYDLSTSDSIVFTTEDEKSLELMSGSVLDVTSPNYSANLESIRSRRGQIAAMFEAQSDAESQVTFEAVNNQDAPLEINGTVELDVNTIWTTNVPDTQTGNGAYNNDYQSHMTLNVDAAGNVHVYSSDNVTDIGNIG